RVLPRVTPDNEFFWTSGADGRLRFLRCDECNYYVHPPSPICPECLSKRLTPTPVSGRATVATFTINHQQWMPALEPPYVIAIDGIATYPGNLDQPPGFSGVGVVEMQDALRLELDWYNGGLENPGQLGSVITACAAVAAGYARHVLCFRVVTEGSAQGTGGRA